jgi:hypothetical protein
MTDEGRSRRTERAGVSRTAVTDGGAPATDETYCSNCGTVVDPAAEICPSCGIHLEDEAAGTGAGAGTAGATGAGAGRAGGHASGGHGGPGGAGQATAGTAGATGAGAAAAGTADQGEEPMGRYLAGLVGGLVMLFAGSVIPLVGHVGGGVVSGYLRGPDTKESAIAGAVGGVISALPLGLIFGLFAVLGLIGGMSGGDAAAGLGIFVFVGGIVLAFLVLYVGMGAVGGAIGAELSDRRPP